MEMNTNINRYLSSDFHPLTLSSVRPETTTPTFHQNSRKKRTKFVRIDNSLSKPKPIKKPDPAAPKITRPCTECGKKFWSWKALFGHMRCHPERQWRGINPPPNFRRPEITSTQTEEDCWSVTEEDHEVASCLLILANGPDAAASDQSPSVTTACTINQATPEYSDSQRDPDHTMVDGAVGPTPTAGLNCGRFECSSCKKVFGSHQALGGHRASHKNVKGCYAITKNDGEDDGCCSAEMMMMKDDTTTNDNNNNGHKCSICFRVFSSGQALGGHMRCHWEKVEEPSRVCGFDLNLAAPLRDDDDASSAPYDSGSLALDLRLGL